MGEGGELGEIQTQTVENAVYVYCIAVLFGGGVAIQNSVEDYLVESVCKKTKPA